jgi:hypothetical protein
VEAAVGLASHLILRGLVRSGALVSPEEVALGYGFSARVAAEGIDIRGMLVADSCRRAGRPLCSSGRPWFEWGDDGLVVCLANTASALCFGGFRVKSIRVLVLVQSHESCSFGS